MANEITVSSGVRWSKNGETVGISISETFDQVGNAAFGNVQTITNTTSQINLGSVSGTKWFALKNFAAKSDTLIIYVDTVTPVVPSTAKIVLHGAQPSLQLTTVDTCYAITNTGTGDLGVVAIEL